MWRSICLLLTGLLVNGVCAATVTLNLAAERLDNAAGTGAIPPGSLVYLVISDDAVFNDPTPSGFTSGNDRIIGEWTMDRIDGFFEESVSLTLDSQNTTGDFLQLYWFPTLQNTSVAPALGTPFGKYRSDTEEDLVNDDDDGDWPWTVPVGGDLVRIEFFDSDALVPNAKNPSNAGDARYTVVPEPSTYAAMFAMGCLAWAAARRRR